MASCAMVGMFPPVTLKAKNRKGKIVPYLPEVRWVDGSLQNDLPMRRLAELYNVNQYMVSQTNPYIVPFLSDKRPRRSKIVKWAMRATKSELTFRVNQSMDFWRHNFGTTNYGSIFNHVSSIFLQEYQGHITLFPDIKPKQYSRLFSNLKPEEVEALILMGQRATWKKIAMIRNQTKISQTLERCFRRLHSK